MAYVSSPSIEIDTQPDETQPVVAADRKSLWRLVLAGIALVATAVRIPGVLWGLPTELHPDEPVITQNAVDLVQRHSLVPQVFYRPDHLEILLSSFAYRIYAWVVAGTSVPADFAAHPGRYLAISRCITVAFAVAAVPLAWCIGRRFSTAAGLVAALLVAFFPPFIANSSYATPDMPLTCMMLAVILASMRYLERPTLLRLFIACATVGVGVTIKYPAAIAGATVGMVVIAVLVQSRDWWRGARHLLLAPVLFLLSVLVVSHALITDLSAVTFQLHNQRGSDHPGAQALGLRGNLVFYVKDYAAWSGLLLVAIALFGGWWCLRQRAVAAIPLLLGVLYWLGLSTVPAHWDRWALPMFLSPLLFAAVGLGRLWQWFAQSWRTGTRGSRLRVLSLPAALTALAAAQVFAGSAAVVAGFAGRDTRIAAMPAFREIGLGDPTAIYDGYTPMLPGRPGSIAFNMQVVHGHMYIVRKPGARYVVTSSDIYGRYTTSQFARERGVYLWVRQHMPLEAQWTPVPQAKRSVWELLAIPRNLRYVYHVAQGGETGPTITVYYIPAGVSRY